MKWQSKFPKMTDKINFFLKKYSSKYSTDEKLTVAVSEQPYPLKNCQLFL
jgi:hypothetical protein